MEKFGLKKKQFAPEEVTAAIAKAFTPRELKRLGNRSFIRGFKYPESRFDKLMFNGGNPGSKVVKVETIYTSRAIQIIYPWDYMCFKYNNEYYAKDRFGHIPYSGTDAREVINNTLNALTAGRTKKEMVLLHGDFTIKDSIIVNDYTFLAILGRIKLIDSSGHSNPLITNSDHTNGNKFIEIVGFGGVIDGNRTTNPDGNIGIYLNAASGGEIVDCSIRNLDFLKTSHNAVRVIRGQRQLLENCRAFDILTHGFYYHYASNSMVNNCFIDYSELDGFAFSGNLRTVANNLVIKSTGRQALSFDGATYCHFSNIIVGTSKYDSVFAYWGAQYNTVEGLVIYESRRAAIDMLASMRDNIGNRFINCVFFNINADLAADTPVVRLRSTSSATEVTGIEFLNCKVYAPNADYFMKEVQEAGTVNYNRAKNCTIDAIGTAPFKFVGNNSFAINCPGFNPVGYISPDPTWGASPWTYVNLDHVPEDIYMSVTTEGDVSSITKNGQNLPVPGTSPTFISRLDPGESLVITYTNPGVLKRFGF